jgi:hypothetical protein
MAAITTWLRILHVPSPAFCWMAWAILGQASGAYVGPTCWAVLFLAAAAAVLHQRGAVALSYVSPWQDWVGETVGLTAAGRLQRLAQLGLIGRRSRVSARAASPPPQP